MPNSRQPRRRTIPHYPIHPPSVSTQEISFEHLKTVRQSKDVTMFSFAAKEYSTAIASRISQVCDDTPDCHSGKLSDLINMLNLFLDAIETMHLQEHVPIEDQMNNALHRAEVVCQKLRHLAARIESRAKPLPCLPHDERHTNATDAPEGGSSPSHSTEKFVYSQASVMPQLDSSLLEHLYIRRKTISDVGQMKSISALSSSKRNAWFLPVGSTTYNRPSSASSDVISRPLHPTLQTVLKGPQHNPRNLQQSGAPVSQHVYRNTSSTHYIYSEHLGEDVNMPLPPCQDIIYDEATGEIKAASFHELIHFLTSWTAVIDKELTAIIFTWFRDFAKPAAFFLELVGLYLEECPIGLSTEQKRAWENTGSARRIRIAKVILDWVTKYWNEAEDRPVIALIRQFIELSGENDPVRHIINRIMKQISFSEDQANILPTPRKPPANVPKKFAKVLPPTGFKLPKSYTTLRPEYTESSRISSTKHAISQLLYFNKSKAGLEEFARQLTLIVSTNFRQLTPIQLIEIWRRMDRRNKEELNALPGGESWSVINTFGKSLATWVTHTIVIPNDIKTRVSIICFWIEVALRCITHGNFYGSSRILSGIEYSSVARMKETILAVNPDNKDQFHTLRRIFQLSNNSMTYRSLLNQEWAPIILPFTDIHMRDVLATEQSRKFADYANGHSVLIPLQGYRLLVKVIKVLEKSTTLYHFVEDKPFVEWFTAQISLFPQQEGIDYFDELHAQSQEKEHNSQDLRAVKDAWDYAKGLDKPFQLLEMKEKERHIASFLKHLANNGTSDKSSCFKLHVS